MKVLNILGLLFTLVVVAEASGKSPKSYDDLFITMQSCTRYISKFGTVCKSSKGKNTFNYKCYCNDKPGFGTISDCFVTGYNNDSSVINNFVNACNLTTEEFYSEYAKIQDEFTANGTEYAKKAKKSNSTSSSSNSTVVLTTPLHINFNEPFVPYRRAYKMYYNNFNLSLDYGAIMLGYWAGVIALAMIFNFFIKMFPKTYSKITGKIVNFFRKNVFLPATFTKKKSQEFTLGFGGFFDGLIPSRIETIVIIVFVLLTGFLNALHIHHVEGNPQYSTKNAELGHFIADRTGITVSYLIPLLILFGGRNNILQWLTGWDFATFIMYHRWISRISVLLVIVHAIAFSVSDKATGKYAKRMKSEFMIWGTVATICGGFILFQAMLFFRRKCYEVFFLIHIVLATFFVVGGFFHLDRMGYGDFMWSAIAVWVFDRVVRIGRILFFGAPKAEVTIKGDETLKVIVPKPRYWKSIPGGHCFIHFVKPTLFWQSHPFTFTATEEDDKIVLYAKIKTGITKQIAKSLYNTPGQTGTVRVLVEGPYGEPSGAGRTCDNLVYVAGGNGIPGIYSECVDVAKKAKNQSIKLVWVVRNWKSLTWFKEELEYLKKTSIITTIYVTQPQDATGLECFSSNNGNDSSIEKNEDYDEKNSVNTSSESIISSIKETFSNIEFIEGRPNIEEQVKKDIQETNGAIGFITCGHPAMVDEVRYFVKENLDASKYKVEFHEQLQTWA